MPHKNQDVFKIAKKILVCYFYSFSYWKAWAIQSPENSILIKLFCNIFMN